MNSVLVWEDHLQLSALWALKADECRAEVRTQCQGSGGVSLCGVVSGHASTVDPSPDEVWDFFSWLLTTSNPAVMPTLKTWDGGLVSSQECSRVVHLCHRCVCKQAARKPHRYSDIFICPFMTHSSYDGTETWKQQNVISSCLLSLRSERWHVSESQRLCVRLTPVYTSAQTLKHKSNLLMSYY